MTSMLEIQQKCELATKEFQTTKECYGENFITFLHKEREFGFLNIDEMTRSMKRWKKNGLRCNKYNFKEYTVNDRIWYSFVIQYCDRQGNVTDDNPMCPLSFGYGTMVSGITYFSRNKRNRIAIQEYLTSSNDE